jgi:hypothetical protein
VKTSATLILFAALLALPAAAQENQPRPDYSRETLQKFVMSIPVEPERRPRVIFHVGAIEFTALGMPWRVGLMLPMSGTGFTTSREWPDPFSLTGTQIATSPRAWRTRRAVSAEMRRIEKLERAKIRVKTE